MQRSSPQASRAAMRPTAGIPPSAEERECLQVLTGLLHGIVEDHGGVGARASRPPYREAPRESAGSPSRPRATEYQLHQLFEIATQIVTDPETDVMDVARAEMLFSDTNFLLVLRRLLEMRRTAEPPRETREVLEESGAGEWLAPSPSPSQHAAGGATTALSPAALERVQHAALRVMLRIMSEAVCGGPPILPLVASHLEPLHFTETVLAYVASSEPNVVVMALELMLLLLLHVANTRDDLYGDERHIAALVAVFARGDDPQRAYVLHLLQALFLIPPAPQPSSRRTVVMRRLRDVVVESQDMLFAALAHSLRFDAPPFHTQVVSALLLELLPCVSPATLARSSTGLLSELVLCARHAGAASLTPPSAYGLPLYRTSYGPALRQPPVGPARAVTGSGVGEAPLGLLDALLHLRDTVTVVDVPQVLRSLLCDAVTVENGGTTALPQPDAVLGTGVDVAAPDVAVVVLRVLLQGWASSGRGPELLQVLSMAPDLLEQLLARLHRTVAAASRSRGEEAAPPVPLPLQHAAWEAALAYGHLLTLTRHSGCPAARTARSWAELPLDHPGGATPTAGWPLREALLRCTVDFFASPYACAAVDPAAPSAAAFVCMVFDLDGRLLSDVALVDALFSSAWADPTAMLATAHQLLKQKLDGEVARRSRRRDLTLDRAMALRAAAGLPSVSYTSGFASTAAQEEALLTDNAMRAKLNKLSASLFAALYYNLERSAAASSSGSSSGRGRHGGARLRPGKKVHV